MLSTNSVFLAVLAAGIASVNAAPRLAAQPVARDATTNRAYILPYIGGVDIDSCVLLQPSSYKCLSGIGTVLPRNAQISSGLQVSNCFVRSPSFFFFLFAFTQLRAAGSCCHFLCVAVAPFRRGCAVYRSLDHTGSFASCSHLPFSTCPKIPDWFQGRLRMIDYSQMQPNVPAEFHCGLILRPP